MYSRAVRWRGLRWRVGAVHAHISLSDSEARFSCHIGKTVLYDTVTKLGWSVSITSHQIKTVIDLLAEEHDWDSISDGEDELVAGRWSNDLQAEQKEQKGKGRGRKETDGNVGKMHRAVPIAAPEEDCIVSLQKISLQSHQLTPYPCAYRNVTSGNMEISSIRGTGEVQ